MSSRESNEPGRARVLKFAVPLQTCRVCPVGRASKVGRGGRCPFVEQQLPAGSTLYKIGGPATLIWFVKKGSVWISPRGVLQGPGAFLGLESIVNDRYLETAIAESDVTVCTAPAIVVDGWLGDADSPARTALEQMLLASCHEEPR